MITYVFVNFIDYVLAIIEQNIVNIMNVNQQPLNLLHLH